MLPRLFLNDISKDYSFFSFSIQMTASKKTKLNKKKGLRKQQQHKIPIFSAWIFIRKLISTRPIIFFLRCFWFYLLATRLSGQCVSNGKMFKLKEYRLDLSNNGNGNKTHSSRDHLAFYFNFILNRIFFAMDRQLSTIR